MQVFIETQIKYIENIYKTWFKIFWPFLPAAATTFTSPSKEKGIKNSPCNQHIVDKKAVPIICHMSNAYYALSSV